MDKRFLDREHSWLLFNGRVLQEADDQEKPLIERLRFLGIFSNNLDEFFRVRFATIRRMTVLGKQARELLGGYKPEALLKKIQEVVLSQQTEYERIYLDITKQLRKRSIFIINEKEIDETQKEFIEEYYQEKLSSLIVPVMLNQVERFPQLKDQMIYHAIKLSYAKKSELTEYALIEIPTDIIPRFLVLPARGRKKYVMYIDDVIRHELHRIFNIFDYDKIEAFNIKLTRDAELDIDNDISRSFIDKLSLSVKARTKAEPVRFVYDKEIPEDLLSYLRKKQGLSKSFDSLIPGGRYHNKRDFMGFPNIGPKWLEFPEQKPNSYYVLHEYPSIMAVMKQRDVLVHYPYQNFNYLIKLLREAAIDPNVTSIKATIYRAAKQSQFVNALIIAARNGKKVTVLVEIQARFDEENNIKWTRSLMEEGVDVIYGVPGLKVHSKLVLINRREEGELKRYAIISTGNFNEKTALIYCDYALFTANAEITDEVGKVFGFFKNNFKIPRYKHLIVSPHFTRSRFDELIDFEIAQAKNGKKAAMDMKMNSLVDREIIEKLYEASQAGVKIRLIVRGICSLRAGVKGLSENIEAISIVGRYLEHARMYIFHHGGKTLHYISSADLMTRNLDNRVEVTCPILSPKLKKELAENFEIGWRDNYKARVLDGDYDNKWRVLHGKTKMKSQQALYDYYKLKNERKEWKLKD